VSLEGHNSFHKDYAYSVCCYTTSMVAKVRGAGLLADVVEVVCDDLGIL
jgi:hypothetical protein